MGLKLLSDYGCLRASEKHPSFYQVGHNVKCFKHTIDDLDISRCFERRLPGSHEAIMPECRNERFLQQAFEEK
jgi:hypothetical protein